MIRHRSSPHPLELAFDDFFSRHRWPVRFARLLGFRPSVKTVEHVVPLRGTWPTAAPLRLAFASDFHAGASTDPALLIDAAAALRHAAPDVLLLGGDYVSVLPRHIDILAPLLREVPAPLGKFAVLGNHDRWVDAEYVVRSLERAGIQVLINQNVRLPAPYDEIWICGLDDGWSGQPDIRRAVVGATGIRIVLMHSPSMLLDVGTERFDLALCGHTHGGQIALPGGIPILVPVGPLSRRYARGRFDLDDRRTMIVSVGLGCSVLPVRIFSQPEVLLCRLAAVELSAESPAP